MEIVYVLLEFCVQDSTTAKSTATESTQKSAASSTPAAEAAKSSAVPNVESTVIPSSIASEKKNAAGKSLHNNPLQS